MNPAAPLLMVVDDDDDVREIVQLLFEAEGYLVRGEPDGLEAWREICLGSRPSLILLDLMMPRMDGEHFLRALRSSVAASIPVVIMSGHSSALQMSRELGADACLTKPIELDQLLATVHRFAPNEARPFQGTLF